MPVFLSATACTREIEGTDRTGISLYSPLSSHFVFHPHEILRPIFGHKSGLHCSSFGFVPAACGGPWWRSFVKETAADASKAFHVLTNYYTNLTYISNNEHCDNLEGP